MATFISANTSHRFTYFDHQLAGPEWTGRKVLDFGGNVGNLLLEPNCRIEPNDYWCMDVSRDAIAEGERRHPKAHFVFYDCYNYEYNPTGTIGLRVPDPGVKFDFIVAYSVFTHNNKTELLNLVDQLMPLLAEDGRLAFTFEDPLWVPPPGHPYIPESSVFRERWRVLYRMYDKRQPGELRVDFRQLFERAEENVRQARSEGWSNLRWTLETHHLINPELDVTALLAWVESTPLTWVALVDGGKLVAGGDNDGLPREDPDNPVDHRMLGYLNFCTAEYMNQLFPNAQIRPPVASERQHCAIIDTRRGTGRP
jgi:SAM-dependent methyltransferase